MGIPAMEYDDPQYFGITLNYPEETGIFNPTWFAWIRGARMHRSLSAWNIQGK